MSFLEGYRLDLGALTADLWNIQPQMVSLGKNLALLQNGRIIALPAACSPEFQWLLVFLDHSHTLLPALSSPITVWARKSKQGGIIYWPSGVSNPAPLLSTPLWLHMLRAPHARKTDQVDGVAGPGCTWRLMAHPAPLGPTCFSVVGRF